MRYFWCANCERKIPATEVVHIPGAMHKICRSGRVTPVKEEKK